jgi:hypothetical protein
MSQNAVPGAASAPTGWRRLRQRALQATNLRCESITQAALGKRLNTSQDSAGSSAGKA